MGHPAVENRTGFAFEPLFLADEELRPLFVPLVKATFAIERDGLMVAAEQAPIALEGECWGLPGESSYRLEPEGVFFKPATDVVLVGEAHAPAAGATEVVVALQVGPLKKGVRVVGDRVFTKTFGAPQLTRPVAFETIPLQWERAFGGWDRSHPDPAKHSCEPRNPVGRGWRGPGTSYEEGLLAPNLEDPARPYRGWGDAPPPAGFGFVCPDWQPRVKLAGTFDAAWDRARKPLLPADFDRRFFNAASPGLVAPGHLRGDEQVLVVGVAPGGKGHSFRLPGGPPPVVRTSHQGGPDREQQLALDTVIIDTIELRVYMLWRGMARLRRDAAELLTIRVDREPLSPATPPDEEE